MTENHIQMRELLSARDNQSQVQALQHGCADNATLTGEFPEGIPEGKWPLCDKTIGDDAVAKLSIAAANLKQTGMPFFLAVGFRKPHTPWRFPAPYLSKCDAFLPGISHCIEELILEVEY